MTLTFDFGQELPQVEFKCSCDPIEVDQADIAQPAFYLADVGAMKPCDVSKPLLRKPTLGPESPHR